jgi:predicted nucleic-acid-binding protein
MNRARRRMADTNLLLRYLTGAPREQHERAVAEIDGKQPIWISVVAILETGYVLLRHYNVPRATIVDVLTELIRKANVHVCELPRQRVIDALALCRDSGRVNFGDALIWARAAEDDAEVLTFDRRFPSDQITVTTL